MREAPQWEPVHRRTPVFQGRWTWRLLLAAVGIGALSAFAAASVRLGFRGLQWMLTGSTADLPLAAMQLPLPRRALTPIVGALLAMGVLYLQRLWRRLQPQEAHKREEYVEYVEAVRRGQGFIPVPSNCWRTVSAAFSVASGATVGREGSMIQFAATMASACARWRGWLDGGDKAQLSLLVACGVAGGVTTAYNAPLAATLFAAEIVLGGLRWLELLPLGLAAGAGWLVSRAMLGGERLYPVHATVRWGPELWLLPLLAVVGGLAGPVYQGLLGSLQRARHLPLPLLWSGIVVGCLSLTEPRVWGNGDAGLRMALTIASLPPGAAGGSPLARVLLLRLCASLACVWTGTVGGVFTPTLFAGSAGGALLAHSLPGGTTNLWAIAGMSFLVAAVTHAPLMSACMAVELTGNWTLLPLLLPLNFVSWWTARVLSPRAMYGIASQTPTHGGVMSSRAGER